MGAPRVRAGGGMAAIRYVLRQAREGGGFLALYRRLRQRNACKTCALGMGGQRGGMVNEAGRFPEVCKKAVQAQVADMAGAIPEAFFRQRTLAEIGRLSSRELEKLGRLTFPLLAGPEDTHFRRVSWEEALERSAAAFRDADPSRTFWYASGRSSNEAAYLMQLVARAYGTNHINNCSYYCHQASGVALSRVYGSGTASVVLEDLARADLAVVTGANPASNHPRLITQLKDLRRRGGRVIVINPLKELGLVRFRVPSDWRSLLFGTTISDLYLQPHIGADVAVWKALLHGVIRGGGVDEAFVRESTSGWGAVRADAEAADPDELARLSGVPRPALEEAVRLILEARRGVFLWAMGLTHHAHGVENILALANLALARGWLGRPGTGMLPIRGHSNVQGVGSVGVTPALKAAFAREMLARHGVQDPGTPGHDTYAGMEAAHAGQVQAAFLLGGNLYGSSPDLTWASEALRRIGTTVSASTKLNTGHVHGRGQTAVILPVLARDEESQATTQESMFNLVRLSDGGKPAVAGEMRSEVEILAELAERLLPAGRFDWKKLRSHRHLREEIGRVVPGYAAIGRMDETREEFQIQGRTFHEPRFATPDGRAHFHVVEVPRWDLPPDRFRLMTLRSEGQFNTVVYEEEDLYRGTTRRDVVLMSDEDADRLGLHEGDRVRVRTQAGAMDVAVSLTDIRPGNLAMYYPEANLLVPRTLDPQSRTPAFKAVEARLELR